VVLDPFIGSGTTAVVCKKMGRDFIGIEINPVYCEYARKKISKTIEENLLELFV
jgi:DNA modification methylase